MTDHTLQRLPAQLTYESLPPQLLSEVSTSGGRLMLLFIPDGGEHQAGLATRLCVHACTYANMQAQQRRHL